MLRNSQIPMKTCSLCRKSSEAEGIALVYFGDWMQKKEVLVHYYCLLLSTHLPQRGEDHSGILGFLLRDIRQEISLAKNRKCKYCFEFSANIQCCKCKEYFHITCGHTSKCLFEFVAEFKSYCHTCLPNDKFQMELFARRPPQPTEMCLICAQAMGVNLRGCIYAKCCGNGYAHSKCMKIYALSAGYYLTCIWCKDKRFREDVKYQGVFVPDREANWEKEKGAYVELYRSHKRCDMEVCNCPKGRDYINAKKWQLIICKFCGAFGAHNPACIPGFEDCKEKIKEFKCDVCSLTEQTVHHKTISAVAVHDLLDTSLYVTKECTNAEAGSVINTVLSQSLSTNNTSNDSTASQDTIIDVNLLKRNNCVINNNKCANDGENIQIAASIYTLTQSPQVSQNLGVPEKAAVDLLPEETAADSDDSAIADLLVEQFLEIFETKD
ncbi:hypothetical protein FF38_07059 [Lucilia cuprina]|uniref:PHD-type domain-containing protein n=1 Tax=Lucilia cuprina TaxID=7375 RepID=A0A0L0CHH6_LUCCU|nr:PHD finger protein 7 [Lucilia cuprina]KNC31705.1 hypothetical protein FF38_07059 [Lucilia cuprina]